MLNYEVKFLTCDDSVHLKNGDFKSYKYETKKRVDESVYDAGKRSYCERRGGNWRAPRPRHMRQLESKLRDRSVVFCDWTTDTLITIVFSTGAIAYLTIKPETLDVTQILFDRYCVGKLSSQAVTGVVLCKSHLLFAHADRSATLVSFGKTVNTQPCRISDRDPHLQILELGGGGRRAERRVSWRENAAGARVLLWAGGGAEPAPWSPALEDLANLHLYQLHGQQVTLLAYHQLENETLSAELAHKCDNIIHIVEQVANHKTGVALDWIRYEMPSGEERTERTKLSSLRESVTRASLPAPARVTQRSQCDGKLLAACIDGSIHVVHHIAGLTHSTRAGFIATDVRWTGDIVVATEEAGRLQSFDRALALLNHHAKCLDFTSYFRDSRRLQILATKPSRGGPLVLASFSGGPLTLLRIMHPRLLTAWVRAGRTGNAVSLLRALDWEAEGTEGLWCINRIVCAALRAGLQGAAGEAAAQAALGAYLAPAAPHGPQAERLAPAVHDLARKFFHHLLRRGRVEKALSLAVDLADWDLFVDARCAAARRALPALAHEAAALAAHYAHAHESDCSDSCSQCSSHSYSGSEVTTSASSEGPATKPPPLPRVPQPTIMPVHTHSEPISTNSIRPNLHQYLERDNTIWNTAVRDDTHVNGYNDLKPILSQSMKCHSVDNVLSSYKQNSKHTLLPISETKSHLMPHDDRMTPAHFRHLLQTELREDVPNTLYRYQSTNNFFPSTSVSRQYRHDGDIPERTSRAGEKNKVKFSDTVTIAVMP
ncbi:WD repeat-containing and planar cell polarity effector protein fritz isoform X4 [Pectinophora gossypiella]|nr:WD repeat-containing and planar cell polarity effector protein fritz isoform X4 [Pectinophora gossypiella]